MKRIIVNILVIIYAIIAVLTTICLLSYNEYKISEFGDNSIILVTNEDLTPDFNKGDLIIVNSGNKSKIDIGDKVFFYNSQDKKVEVALAQVTNKEIITSKEITFTVGKDHEVSSQYVLGATKNATVIPVVGGILGVLESKWGFLFLIVFPSLIAFLYELTVVFSEIKEERNIEEKSKRDSKVQWDWVSDKKKKKDNGGNTNDE